MIERQSRHFQACCCVMGTPQVPHSSTPCWWKHPASCALGQELQQSIGSFLVPGDQLLNSTSPFVFYYIKLCEKAVNSCCSVAALSRSDSEIKPSSSPSVLSVSNKQLILCPLLAGSSDPCSVLHDPDPFPKCPP